MSVPKYIKEFTPRQKLLKKFSFIGSIALTIIWIVHIRITLPGDPIEIFIYPELYAFLVCIVVFTILYLKAWKLKIATAETDIFETIAYREKTSIKNLAKVKKIKERQVITIIDRLLAQEKLFGIVKDGLFISEKTVLPVCDICKKEITEALLMSLCPYCKRVFHKDHLIDYINEMEQKCPNCKHPLTLADIIK